MKRYEMIRENSIRETHNKNNKKIHLVRMSWYGVDKVYSIKVAKKLMVFHCIKYDECDKSNNNESTIATR